MQEGKEGREKGAENGEGGRVFVSVTTMGHLSRVSVTF